ncbi:MAG: DUF6062 family protein [Bacillota bacterium]
MRYQIETIPVWDALEFQGGCALCTLRAKTEAEEIERALGASVMEPDVRVRTNERGICCKHQQMMFQTQNRLGHALLMDTHAAEALEKLHKLQAQANRMRETNGKPLTGRSPGKAIAEKLRALTAHCVVCENIDTHMERYSYTLLHLWKTEPKFKRQFVESRGLCIPHAADLIEASDKHLNAQQRKEFTAVCLNLLLNSLAEDEKDLLWFTQKFDYRNQHKPWGNSKNAIERTVNRLRGYCLGEAPFEKPRK